MLNTQTLRHVFEQRRSRSTWTFGRQSPFPPDCSKKSTNEQLCRGLPFVPGTQFRRFRRRCPRNASSFSLMSATVPSAFAGPQGWERRAVVSRSASAGACLEAHSPAGCVVRPLRRTKWSNAHIHVAEYSSSIAEVCAATATRLRNLRNPLRQNSYRLTREGPTGTVAARRGHRRPRPTGTRPRLRPAADAAPPVDTCHTSPLPNANENHYR